MESVIACIIIMIVCVGFTTFIFGNVVKRINNGAKKFFIDKLQEYDYLVEKKKKDLADLREEIKRERKRIEILKKTSGSQYNNTFDEKTEQQLIEMQKYKNGYSQIPIRPETIYDLPTPKYSETSFFRNYKELKKKFDINPKEILQKFIKESDNGNDKDDEEFNLLDKFRSKFSDKILYECSTLDNEQQYELITSILTKKEEKYFQLDKTEEKEKFTVRELIEKVEDRMKKIDPTIYVYVGDKKTNYNKLSNKVKTCFYKNMSEGIIISYKGKMYDYSI